MDAAVVRPQRRRPAVHLPIKRFGRLAVSRRFFRSATAVDEHPDHSDLAGTTVFEELLARNVMRSDAAMESDLNAAVALPSRVNDRLTFTDRVAGRLFEKDVRARFEGR